MTGWKIDGQDAGRELAGIGRVMVLGLVAALLAGCGSIAETASEQLAERAIEAGGGTDADVGIDADTGQITIQTGGTDGGSMTLGGGEVPPGIAALVALPDDHEVITSGTLEGVSSVSIRTGDEDAFDRHVATWEADGWQQESMTTAGELRSGSWTRDGARLQLIAIGSDGDVTMTVNLDPGT